MDSSERRRANQVKKKKKKLVVGNEGVLTASAAASPSTNLNNTAITHNFKEERCDGSSTPSLQPKTKSSSSNRSFKTAQQKGQLLSFDENEEADTQFVLKKERKRKGFKIPTDQPISTATPALAISYSSEELQKLRANQSFTPGAFREKLAEASLDDNELQAIENSDGNPSGNGSFIEAVPENDMVNFARQRRKMLRDIDSEEFIPLEEDANGMSSSIPSSNPVRQRLVRDDDDDDDDGDGTSTSSRPLSFDAAARKLSKYDRLKQMEKALFNSEANANEDDLQWEENALRRAATVNVAAGITEQGQPRTAESQRLHRHGYYVGMGPDAEIPLDIASPMVTLESIQKKLKNKLDIAKEMSSSHKQHAQRITSDLASLREEMPLHESNLRNACKRYNFFKELKIYVKNLVECLDVKAGEIESLEKSMHGHLKKIADRIKQRFILDHHDRAAAATHNVLRLPEDSQKRIFARQDRRRKKKEAQDLDDDAWSDMELDECEAEDADVTMQTFFKEANNILSDVNEDFSSISKIAHRFEAWKTSYPESYKTAYASLSFRKILHPLLTLQLITWNPLSPISPDFESMPWFKDLLLYGFDESKPTNDTADIDADLIPNLLGMVLVPKLSGFLEHVYDPLSSVQTDSAKGVALRLIHDFHIDFTHEDCQQVIDSVSQALKAAIERFPSLYIHPPNILRGGDVNSFQTSWVKHLVKLTRNVMAWRDVVPEAVVQEIVFGSILGNIVQETLTKNTDTFLSLGLLSQVASVFPKGWLGSDAVKKSPLSDKMVSFRKYLCQFAQNLTRAEEIYSAAGALEGFGDVKTAEKLRSYASTMNK